MLKWFNLAILSVGCLLAFGSQPAARADAAGLGSIHGTVTGLDGQPAANVEVKLHKPHAKGEKKTTALAEGAGKHAGHGHGEALATTTTNGKGEFNFPGVAAGEYIVSASIKGTGHGHAKVTVVAGESATASIVLTAHTKKPKQ